MIHRLMWRASHTQRNKLTMNPQILQWLKEEETYPDQGSDGWLAMRRSLITASIASDLLGTSLQVFQAAIERNKAMHAIEIKIGRNYNTRAQMMEKKTTGIMTRKSKPDQAMLDHGTRCEHIIRDLLEKRAYAKNPLDIYIPLKFRARDGWIGASPDGCFNLPLRLVEIKTLVWRSMSEGVIPHKYWVQMQCQMYVYNVRQCEYVEARVEFLDSVGEWETRHGLAHVGVASLDPYGNIHTCPVDLSYKEWHDTTLVQLSVLHGHHILYYHIAEMQIKQVVYDEEWMTNECLPRLRDSHRQIYEAHVSKIAPSIKRRRDPADQG